MSDDKRRRMFEVEGTLKKKRHENSVAGEIGETCSTQ